MDENYAVRRSDEIEREIKLKFYPPPKAFQCLPTRKLSTALITYIVKPHHVPSAESRLKGADKQLGGRRRTLTLRPKPYSNNYNFYNGGASTHLTQS